MKHNIKILVGFSSVIILIFVQVAITYKLQNDILENMRQIKNVEAPLYIMIDQIIGYDGILTAEVYATLLHAQKGDYAGIGEHEHKEKYNEISTKLDDLLKRDIYLLLHQSNRSQEVKEEAGGYLKTIDEANMKLFDLETRAFEAIEKNDIETAYSFIVSNNYREYKNEFYQNCKALTDIEYKKEVEINDDILKKSQQIIYLNMGMSIVIIIIIIITMLIIRFFFVKKEKELKVREKMEQKYRILFENAIEAIFIADSDTRRLVDCNHAAERLMGYSQAELLSMKADDLHPKDKVKETMKKFQDQVEGKIKSVVTVVLTKHKKRIPVKIDASTVKIGGKLYSQGIFIEIK